jgi:hypothetical protein
VIQYSPTSFPQDDGCGCFSFLKNKTPGQKGQKETYQTKFEKHYYFLSSFKKKKSQNITD